MLNKAILALIGALVLGLWFQHIYVNHLKEIVAIERQAAESAQQRTQEARQQALAAIDELAEAERQRRASEAEIKALQEALAEQAASYDDLRQRIRRAPASDNGPVAPVLRDTLERLP